MADEEKDRKEQPEAQKKKFPVMIVVVALVGVLVIAGAAAGYFLVLAPKMKGGEKGEGGEAARQVHAAKAEGHGGGGGETPPSLKPLDPFIVNLSDAQGQRYLKAVVQLETDNPAAEAEINTKLPQVRDEILMILSNKTFDDVASVAGKRMLKREIAQAVNRYLVEGRVTNVYFTEFVVQ